eukprot:6175868-Pleurochrysis_carterae.AAC.6
MLFTENSCQESMLMSMFKEIRLGTAQGSPGRLSGYGHLIQRSERATSPLQHSDSCCNALNALSKT